VSSLAQRTVSATPRLPEGNPRDLQEVRLVMVDGTQVKGMLHRAPGTRTLDYLNRQAEGFVAMTDAELLHEGRAELVSFIAINKAHIIRVIEASDSI
jgi:hypothetical protein